MARDTKKISTLIESQLPGFISSEYEKFSKFIEKYYESLESAGKPLDILNNIEKYRDINFYEKNLLTQKTNLTESILASSTSIEVEDASSFPEVNGYIRIGNEICFYKERTNTQFLEVSRGVSGNTTLGDLYDKSEFVGTQAAPHYNDDEVYNISNLFLYAFVKNFEEEYLGAFPEKYLKGEVDKRTLIKNINKFYKAKGTDRSIKFIFNSIISQDPKESVSVYNPKDFTLKASVSDWITKYALKVKVLSGNPKNLIGNVITQFTDDYDKSITFASAVVDNVSYLGKYDGEDLYEIVLEPSTVNGSFKVASRTTLRSNLSSSTSSKGRIDVFSTMGFPKQGKLLVDNEVISFNDKNVNQLIIDSRSNPVSHQKNKTVYSLSTIEGTANNEIVRLLTLGVLYNLLPEKGVPYSESGDIIQEFNSGFETRDPVIFDVTNNNVRWLLNTNFTKVNSIVPGVNSQVGDLNADVSAIYEDDQYYYVASSSFPSHNDLLTLETIEPLSDQKSLKLIRKFPITTTETYETSDRDVGILVDGSPIFSYKDFESVIFGKIESVKIENKGSGYQAPPTILINEQPGKAISRLSGETIDSIVIISEDVYESDPTIRVTSGEGAKLSAVVTEGRISSIRVVNPGRYYSSPPTIRIIDELGKGNFAEYEAVLDNEGKISTCRRISGGRFYTRGNVLITVEPAGKGAQATAKVKRWVKNRYEKLKNNLDTNRSYVFPSFDGSKGYGYGVVANPVVLRRRLGDSITATYQETLTVTHSPIIGYAYDGNPIYGPYGYIDPVNSNSPVERLSSGYSIKVSRPNGPSIIDYPLGTFVDDYEWIPSINTGKTELDQNNGRFCVTPDYPNGVYAYFVSIDEFTQPQFPYFIGKNYYSLPVDSNYNSTLSQDDLPVNARRLKSSDFEVNGNQFYGYIQDVKSGEVSSATVYESTDNFSINSLVSINNSLTDGSGAAAIVSSVKGKNIVSIESTKTKASQFTITQNAYLFEGDTITQENTNATGILIGDSINENKFVLRNIQGKFNEIDVINSNTKVVTLILDKNSIFTQGETITLTDGKGKDDSDIATGIILEGILRQNSVKIKVTSGEFIVNNNYFLKSSSLGDTTRTKIIKITSLSENLNIFNIENNIAIVKTSEPHNIAIGDKVNVDIIPDDSDTETTYFVRKRLYQEAILTPARHFSTIVDTGVGSADILNSGSDYEAGTYQNVELIFQDSSKARRNIGKPGDSGNARATITISNPNDLGYGGVGSITIVSKGSGYKTGDVLTVADSSLDRLTSSTNTQRLVVVVDHVGFAEQNSVLKLTNVNNLSTDDYLKLNQEIVKIVSVNVPQKTVTVLRGQKNTRPKNHYNKLQVELFESNYRFTNGYKIFGEGTNKPLVVNYDEFSKKLFISFNYSAENPERILQSSSFFDQSIPAKLVTIRTVESPQFNLEFSKDTEDNLVTNPVINIQKYYKYKFDTSHFSMVNTFLDFSSSSNYNIFTEEKFVSPISPGNNGSFVNIKLGFGPSIASNTFQNKKRINFSNYFYFIKVSPNVNTNNSFLRVVEDPLNGEKVVTYTTNNKFVYLLDNTPEHDGSGEMTYSTTSEFAVGKINKITVINKGDGYKKIPVVDGVLPSSVNECIVEPIYNFESKSVVGFKIINSGKNYSKPVAVVVDGDGFNYDWKCFSSNGNVTKIDVLNPGKNFSYKPTVKILESDVQIYLNSDNIGIPQNVKIVNNGALFNSDKTTLPQYKSNTSFVLKDFGDTIFYPGEIITQPSTGATAKVAKNGWRNGSNLLKVEKIKGVFKADATIKGRGFNRQATIVDELSTIFVSDVKSYYDNLGFYSSDKGKIGVQSQKLTDSYFYQDYSYVVKSKTSIDVWRQLIKETTHPAGFQLFGEINIDSEAEIIMPSEQKEIQTFVSITLDSLNVTVVNTKKQVTNSIVNLDSLKVEKGIGAVSVDTFDSSETLAYEVILSENFDGDYDYLTGRLKGNRTFTLIDKKNNLALPLDTAEQLFVTLDGVFQEPGVAYTISGSSITFATAPLGIRIVEGQEVNPQRFYARAIKFKDSELNSKYFKKLRSIESQFDGSKKDFDLYYENGTIVKTDNNENLIVGLNGVVQNAKINENDPFGNSYYIIRSEDPTVTDKIVFTSAPIDQEDLYNEEEIPSELKGFEKCFIYSVSNYERFTIDPALIKTQGGGPYLILDEVKKTVRKIDDPLYALVFIDGVLQESGKSYQIVGPTITFTSPLKEFISDSGEISYQKVSIILVYGRDLPKTLTFYDFEPNTYFNIIKLKLTGTNVYQNFYNLYGFTSGGNVVLYQNDYIIGRIKFAERITDDEIIITLIGNNLLPLNNDNVKFVDLGIYELEIELFELEEPDDGQIYDWIVNYSEPSQSFFFVDPSFSLVSQNPTLTLKQNKTLTLTTDTALSIVTRLSFVNTNEYTYNVSSLETISELNEISYSFIFEEEGENPTIQLNQGDILSLNVNTDGRKFSIVKSIDGSLNEITLVSNNITNNETDFGNIIWNTSLTNPDEVYYYINLEAYEEYLQLLATLEPAEGEEEEESETPIFTEYGSIVISPYVGIYWDPQNEISGNFITNNGISEGIITWNLTVPGTYYYVSQEFQSYGIIIVRAVTPTFIPSITSKNKEYLVEGEYNVNFEYFSGTAGERLLGKDIPSWLFNSVLGDEAWFVKSSIYGNLLPGDKIQIDGELDYREIINLPNYGRTRQYNEGEIVSNQLYSKVQTTNYNGIIRGEGLSVTANVSREGSIESLTVSGLEWNRRDLEPYFTNNVLSQPTAYQYYTNPVIYFIPVDGNGGGAKAEVISHGGQILDIVLIDGGYGYTQPPQVVVARRYNRIKKESRKIGSLTILTVSPQIGGFEYITSSFIEITGAAGAEQAISSIITLGGFAGKEAPQRDITTIILPEPKILATSQTKFNSELRVQSPSVYVEYNLSKIEKEIITIIDAKADIISSSTIQSISREITKRIKKILNNSIIEVPNEATNDIGAFLDAPLSETDTIVYIADTRRFPDASRLLIGKEIVLYGSKLSDRFLNVVRGAFGTTATTHEAGDYLRHLPELVSIVPVGPTTSIITEVTITEIHQTDSSIVRVFSTLADNVSNVSIEDNTEIEVTLEQQIDVDNSDFDVVKQITIIPPTTYVTSLNSYSSTYISFISAAAIDEITQVSSIINTISDVDIQITDTIRIDVDNSNTTISTQLVASAESSIESLTSSIVTIVNNDSVIENSLQLINNSSYQNYSITILIVGETTVDTISSITNTVADVTKQITIIPPTTYVTSLNSYSSTYISIISSGVSDVTEVISSIANTITSIDYELINILNIDLDKLDNIISSQTTVSAASSVDSVSSSIVTIVNSDSLITNEVQLNVYSSINSTSTQIISGQDTSIFTILSVTNTVETTINQYITEINTTNTVEFGSYHTNITLLVAGIADTVFNKSIVVSNKLAKNADIEIFYKTGVLDYFEESVALFNPIKTRSGFITIPEPINEVIIRDLSSIFVGNKSIFKEDFYDSYSLGNAGFTLKSFENNVFVNTGSYGVNGSIESLINSYPSLTIKDFEERPNSSITLGGTIFNLGIPSINSAGSFVSSNIDNQQTVIQVQSTRGFPTQGKLLLGKEILTYTNKTSNTFTGVTRGVDNTIASSHSIGNYLRSFD
jgi:hypothetical protein